MLESLTEREREEEFYRRTEKREELKKRYAVLVNKVVMIFPLLLTYY